MNCQEARMAMLAGQSSEALASHLAACHDCRIEQAAWARTRAVLSAPVLWEEPPAGLGARIQQSVRSVASSPAGESSAVRWPLVAAVAAALILVFGGVSWWRGALPDWESQLAATAEAPTGTVTVQGWLTAGGTRMLLHVAGIEPAPAGSYYEIWLTAPDGRHVSAGTFTGPGRVTAFAGVRRADFPRIWITMEPVDGDLGPSPVTYFDTA